MWWRKTRRNKRPVIEFGRSTASLHTHTVVHPLILDTWRAPRAAPPETSMTRCTALTLALSAAALVIVASKSSNVQHADRHVTQVASSVSVDGDAISHSGYIIASS